MPKILRVTTIPISLNLLLKGQLSYAQKHGFEVITASADGDDISLIKEREGVKHFVIPFTRVISPWQDLVCLWRTIQLIRVEKPEIIHSHTPKAGLIAMLAGKICGVKHRIHTVAGMPLMEASGISKLILTVTEFLTYWSATHVFPNSQNLESWIKSNFTVAHKKLKVIGKGSSNGIDTNYFDTTEALRSKATEFRACNNISENAMVFCFVGRLVRDKGIVELVAAFDSLTVDNTYLVLVGNYEDQREPLTVETKNKIRLNEKIIAVGFQSDIRMYLAASDVFVFPSYREGFPNALLQACAMGLPSIATNINGNNEIIQPGQNGLLIETKNTSQLKESMEELCLNASLRTKLAANARPSIMDYKQENVWQLILQEYQKLM
ncbi:glycosyltransferase family 4 protein [Fulvivirga sp.]|uniref:glycosyltransferase family 4 protein n=1 Tax=Fulvivirga sp. TaxID=1931237 RepID=UPI0032ED7C09